VTHPYLTGTRVPRILAHRGLVTAEAAAAGVVDNSFAAVAAAHAAGAEYVESDCHVTADGVVVLLHDDDLTRIANDPRKVAAVSSHELSDLLAPAGGLLTLEQALDAFPTLRFNLDVKAPGAAAAVGRLVASHAERVLVTSFSDQRRLAALEAAERAGAPLRPATSPGSRTLARLLAAVALRHRRAADRLLGDLDALQIPERHAGVRVLTGRLLDAAHARGVEVHVWTVNEIADMQRLRAAGVDGIVTDRADVALSLIG
jgi:glycerophosphoryl diester phosphodiesterase